MTSALKKKLLLSLNRPIRPQDVFATSLYTGNGGTQTITNGLDLAGKGGLVWTKNRVTASDPQNRHRLYDSVRGINNALTTNNTNAEQGLSVFSSWNSDGFTLGGGSASASNVSGEAYASWSFRRAKKFFDTVTYTGNGVAGRQIPHGLGDIPGMAIFKRRDGASDWNVRHRSIASPNKLQLNATDAQNNGGAYSNDANTFTPAAGDNQNGVQYVAYLFAHNPDLIDCGSYAGTNGTNNVVCGNGWPTQFVMIKRSSDVGNWSIHDTSRGNSARLAANTSAAEATTISVAPTANGFSVAGIVADYNTSGSTYVYLAIRAPT